METVVTENKLKKEGENIGVGGTHHKFLLSLGLEFEELYLYNRESLLVH